LPGGRWWAIIFPVKNKKEVMKMLFMLTMTWPTKSSGEVGKVAVENLAKASPPHVKRLGLYLTPGGDGMKAYVLYEIEKGHIDEGFNEVTKRHVPYFSIEGWRYTIEPLLSVEEALPLVGL
jgi:hypothetical protein